MSGQTTRIIDCAVQKLFSGDKLLIPTYRDKISDDRHQGIISIFDKDFENKYKLKVILDPDWREGRAQVDMFERLVRRLEIEHGLILKVKHNHYYGFTISLEDFIKQ